MVHWVVWGQLLQFRNRLRGLSALFCRLVDFLPWNKHATCILVFCECMCREGLSKVGIATPVLKWLLLHRG